MNLTSFTRRRLASVVVCTVAAAVLAAPAESAAAPCPAGTFPAVSVYSDTLIAYGREVRPGIDPTSSQWKPVGSVQLTFAAADPAKPISHPFTYVHPSVGTSFDYAGPPIKFERGDGSGRLEATWTQRNSQTAEQCDMSEALGLTPVEGALAWAWAFKTSSPGLNGSNQSLKIRIHCSSLVIDPITLEPLELDSGSASPAPIEVTVRGGGGKRTTVLSDQCEGIWNRQRAHTRRWRISARGTAVEIGHQGRSRRAPLSLRFKVTQAGVSLARGRFRMATISSTGYTIWEGTDAFVNVCINRGFTIYSSGGRLYCETPRVRRTVIYGLHWR